MTIEVRDVTKRFGEFVALDDVSVAVDDGSLTALLGPSGSGKSTLLRVIAGLEAPDAGTVLIAGEDATGVPARRRGLGFVFQHYAAFRHMTVRDNVGFALSIRRRPKAEIRARVNELLTLVGLAGLHERYPDQLSGGQRQRMALARALAVEPRVLLLDEPFGALDTGVRAELRAWLRRLHDDTGVTTVLVTHDQEEALEVADRIVVMRDGRIEQAGTPRELYDRPANDFVMGFLGSVSRIGDSLVRPFEIELRTEPVDGAPEGMVRRTVHLGFVVRVELVLDDGTPLTVELSRPRAEELELAAGDIVWVVSDVARRPGRPPATAPAPAAGR
ncbi:MAG: sulfate transporter, ATPase subunit [Solirubrobacterales bacterium]|jgi:sulfate transport system ATP-binding protein|nr:sulfate transporter, ATPase subunit [Solirubrobacterales bacterium]